MIKVLLISTNIDQSLGQSPGRLHQWFALIVFIRGWRQRNCTGRRCCELSTPPHPLPPSVCFPSSFRSPWWVSSFCWASTSPPWLPAWAACTEHPGSSSASPRRGSSPLWPSWGKGWVAWMDGWRFKGRDVWTRHWPHHISHSRHDVIADYLARVCDFFRTTGLTDTRLYSDLFCHINARMGFYYGTAECETYRNQRQFCLHHPSLFYRFIKSLVSKDACAAWKSRPTKTNPRNYPFVAELSTIWRQAAWEILEVLWMKS